MYLSEVVNFCDIINYIFMIIVLEIRLNHSKPFYIFNSYVFIYDLEFHVFKKKWNLDFILDSNVYVVFKVKLNTN